MRLLSTIALITALATLISGCETTTFTGEYSRISGDYEFDMPDSDMKDEVDADMYRVRLEMLFGDKGKPAPSDDNETADPDEDARARSSGVDPNLLPGVGLDVVGIDPKEDLFVDQGFLPVESGVTDVFLYGKGVLDYDYCHVPVKFGLFYNTYDIEDAAGSIAWRTIGPKISVRPTVPVKIDDDLELSFFAEGNAGIGLSAIDVDLNGLPSETESSTGWCYGYEFGVTLRYDMVHLGVSYLDNLFNVNENDIEEDTVYLIEETRNRFQGLAITVGVRF